MLFSCIFSISNAVFFFKGENYPKRGAPKRKYFQVQGVPGTVICFLVSILTYPTRVPSTNSKANDSPAYPVGCWPSAQGGTILVSLNVTFKDFYYK